MMILQKVGFSYSDYFSLKNIGLKIERGQLVGLIGQSGSGKSTLLKLMAGWLDPLEGQIVFDNQKLIPPSQKLIPGHEKIKMVTQNNSLFPNITIKENIAYELRYYNKNYQEKRVKYLAKKLNISKLLDKKPFGLSGGEIQRVMIARALADEPWLLLLDEPFANLDTHNKKLIIAELNQIIKNDKIACVLVTHEIVDILGWVDQIVILSKGRMVQKGTSEEIYHQPVNKTVASLSGSIFLYNNGNSFFRPENIILKKNGTFKSELAKCIFKGNHYENYIFFDQQLIYFNSSKPMGIGQIIEFEIDLSDF